MQQKSIWIMSKTESKHTPGPWSRSGTHIRYQKNPGAYRFDIAEVFRDVGALTSVANARLIAAAPELLEALRIVHSEMGKRISHDAFEEFSEACKDAILAAIAKAEGA